MRAAVARPTGIDRVERAYVNWAVNRPGGAWLVGRIGGEGRDGAGAFGARLHFVPPDAAQAMADMLVKGQASLDLSARLQPWRAEAPRRAEAAMRRLSRITAPMRGRGLTKALTAHFPEGGIWLNTGHENLSGPLLVALSAAGLRSVVLIHDLIPITHPEFARPEAARRFSTRLDAALAADRHLYNSKATARGVTAYAELRKRPLPPGDVLRLGVEAPAAPRAIAPTASQPGGAGHFVQLGTIEGRKNHLLTLMLWRGLTEDVASGPAPHLHIVGRRGWSAEQAIAMLDRSETVGRTVFEHRDLGDDAVAALLAEARALLFPSFAEGYGLPLGEALAAGVPVIAADLPALRELGGDVPEWLAPQDGPGWLAAIRDYARPGSPRRNAQLARLAEWRRPRWDSHFARLEEVLEKVGATRS
ncbi:MAG: glycosyltransferase [Pseudomonadota bacterium]